MIIVNYWHDKDYDPINDGYSLELAGIVNDSLDLHNDIQLIEEAIENDDNFEPKDETLYEIYLTRATIASDPMPECAFAIHQVIEKVQDPDYGWITPIVRM